MILAVNSLASTVLTSSTVFTSSTAFTTSTVFKSGAVLAGGTPNSTQTLNEVEPGVLGFLVVAAMGLALVFLLRSMNKQFRKIGPKPEEDLLPDGTVPGEVLSSADDRTTADAGTD